MIERSKLAFLEVVGLGHGLLLDIFDPADSESDQNLVQGFLDCVVFGILLQIHNLLKIHFVCFLAGLCQFDHRLAVVADL